MHSLHKTFIYALVFIMNLSILTLNTRGCSSSVKNISLYTYIENICNRPDILLLQETCTISDTHSLWKSWSNYTPHCNASPSRGSGVITLINNKVNTLNTNILYDGYLSCTKIFSNNVILYIYNLLMPQTESEAVKVLSILSESRDLCSDGVTVLAGDFNCTLNPGLDRLNRPSEHRPKTAKLLKNLIHDLSLNDVWRKQNPTGRKYTWHRNNPSSTGNI